MKTAILAAAAALMTAPAFAQVPSGALGAIAHFNQDKSGNEVVQVIEGTAANFSSRSGVVEATVHFNQDKTGNELRRESGQTVVSGTPTYGADIFRALAAENDDRNPATLR